MAQAKPTRRRRKLPETVRERAQKQQEKAGKQPHKRLAKTTRPVGKLRALGQRQYHPVKLRGDSRSARFLSKPRRLMPAYLRESWAELKQVKWPNRRETLRLTLAVFVFAVIFMVIIQAMDFVFDKLFKEILL